MNAHNFKLPATGQISVTLTEVTPAMAATWLATQRRNRKLRPRALKQLVRDMTAGEFAFTAAGVSFDDAGQLIDGQHRLNAIVLSSATVPLFVFRGFPAAVQDSMDMGAARTVAEQLGMDGQSSANHITAYTNAIARGFCGYEYKLTLRQVREINATLPRIALAVKADHPKLDYRSSTYLGLLALALHLPKKEDVVKVGKFFDAFTKGVGIDSESHPAWHLRQFVRNKGTAFSGKLNRDAASYCLDCLQAYLTGEPLSSSGRPTGTGRAWLQKALAPQYAALRKTLGFAA